MEKLTIKDLVEYRRMSERRKKVFFTNIENKEKKALDNKEKKEKGGGDYWVSCITAIENVFKNNNIGYIRDKINEIQSKLDSCEIHGTRINYQANIHILQGFGEFDFKDIRPTEEFKILHQVKSNDILTIKSLPIKSNPTIVFSFPNGELTEIGCLSFIAQKKGFKNSELGMFAESHFRYLEKYFSDKYKLSPDFIMVVDAVDIKTVRYSDILKGDLIPLLDSTIDEINDFKDRK